MLRHWESSRTNLSEKNQCRRAARVRQHEASRCSRSLVVREEEGRAGEDHSKHLSRPLPREDSGRRVQRPTRAVLEVWSTVTESVSTNKGHHDAAGLDTIVARSCVGISRRNNGLLLHPARELQFHRSLVDPDICRPALSRANMWSQY